MSESEIIIKTAEPFLRFFHSLLGTLSYPADVVWRHHQGERVCTWWRAVLHLILIYLFAAALPMPWHDFAHPANVTNQAQDKASEKAVVEAKKSGIFVLNEIPEPKWTIAGLIVVCFVLASIGLCSCLNLLELRNKRVNGIVWHSKFYGAPRFLPDSHLSNAWIIPLGTLAFGCWSGYFVTGLGLIICFYAMMQVASYRLEEARLRKQWLDQLDRSITTCYMREAIEQWQQDGTTQSHDTHGLSVQGLLKTDERQVFETQTILGVLDEQSVRAQFASLLNPNPNTTTQNQK